MAIFDWRSLAAQLRFVEVLNVAISRVEHVQRIDGDAKPIVKGIAESRVKQRAALGVDAAIEFVIAEMAQAQVAVKAIAALEADAAAYYMLERPWNIIES